MSKNCKWTRLYSFSLWHLLFAEVLKFILTTRIIDYNEGADLMYTRTDSASGVNYLKMSCVLLLNEEDSWPICQQISSRNVRIAFLFILNLCFSSLHVLLLLRRLRWHDIRVNPISPSCVIMICLLFHGSIACPIYRFYE